MNANGFVHHADQGQTFEGSPGRSFRLRITNGQTDRSVMMFEEVAPPETATDLHLHRDSDEIAYVLEGEITFNIDGVSSAVWAGGCAFMPRGTAHAWKSTGSGPGRVLFMYTPGTAGLVFEEAAELGPPPPNPDPVMLAELFGRHGWEILGPPPF